MCELTRYKTADDEYLFTINYNMLNNIGEINGKVSKATI
jgi:hypothetical protein